MPIKSLELVQSCCHTQPCAATPGVSCYSQGRPRAIQIYFGCINEAAKPAGREGGLQLSDFIFHSSLLQMKNQTQQIHTQLLQPDTCTKRCPQSLSLVLCLCGSCDIGTPGTQMISDFFKLKRWIDLTLTRKQNCLYTSRNNSHGFKRKHCSQFAMALAINNIATEN